MGLSKETTELMLTPFVEDNVGIGIFLLDKKGETYFGHGGWNEGFSSDMVAHKTKGYGAVVMINSNHPDFINELIRSVALTYQWDAYVPSYQAQEVNLDVANKIAGRYQTGGNDFITIALSDNQLSYQGGPEQKPVQMIQISDSTYVIREMDVLFQFKGNESSDSITMMRLNPYTMELDRQYQKICWREHHAYRARHRWKNGRCIESIPGTNRGRSKHPRCQ